MIKSLLDSDEPIEKGAVEPQSNGASSIFGLAETVTEQESIDLIQGTSTDPLPEAAADRASNVSNWDEPFESPEKEPAIVIAPYRPPSTGETIRRSGLAWSAGVVFFGSVVFTMILGWFADLLLGTSPWGLVAGIVLGSIIAFINFFRITGQIFKNN